MSECVTSECVTVTVAPEVCTVYFGDEDPVPSGGVLETTVEETVRGDLCFIHLDENGRLHSIELVGGKQPCQVPEEEEEEEETNDSL